MINHYEILGLSSTASILEIKGAFRKLAKKYHPDINPAGKEHFNKILKAYEILSNPTLKQTYDYRLKNSLYSLTSPSAKSTQTKNWKFDEKEQKRRQYYDEHIKKYAKTVSDFKSNPEPKSNYNEFKYILYATPIAVALFLLIMKLAIPSKSLASNQFENQIQQKKTYAKNSDLMMGDAPYAFFFGKAQYDRLKHRSLSIKNISESDIIVCLFSKNKFVRSRYIENGFMAEIADLPSTPLRINYCRGLNFNYSQELQEVKIFGAFTRDLVFLKGKHALSLDSTNEITFAKTVSSDFEQVGEKQFFKIE